MRFGRWTCIGAVRLALFHGWHIYDARRTSPRLGDPNGAAETMRTGQVDLRSIVPFVRWLSHKTASWDENSCKSQRVCAMQGPRPLLVRVALAPARARN